MNKQAVAKELVMVAKELTAITYPDGSKVYNTMFGVGKAKYVVNFHDGVSTHKDGSAFYDIALFSNKAVFIRFIQGLVRDGYKEESRFA